MFGYHTKSVRYSSHSCNNKPFKTQIVFNHPNTKSIRYSDHHYTTFFQKQWTRNANLMTVVIWNKNKIIERCKLVLLLGITRQMAVLFLLLNMMMQIFLGHKNIPFIEIIISDVHKKWPSLFTKQIKTPEKVFHHY